MVDPDRVHVGSALDRRPLHQGQQRQGNGSAGRREDVGAGLQLQPVEAHLGRRDLRTDQQRHGRDVHAVYWQWLARRRRSSHRAGWRRSAFLVDDDPARVLTDFTAGLHRPKKSNGRPRTPVFFAYTRYSMDALDKAITTLDAALRAVAGVHRAERGSPAPEFAGPEVSANAAEHVAGALRG